MAAEAAELAGAWDVVVLGAGAGGMTAAATAAAYGLKTLLIEKTDRVGGTTSMSGGMVWLPNNPKMAEMGVADSTEAAMRYLDATVGAFSSTAMKRAFLAAAPDMLRFMEAHTSVRLRPVKLYPDYFPDLPGATLGGRVMETLAFDGKLLGDRFAWVRPPPPEFLLLGGMMVDRQDIVHLRRALRRPASAWHGIKLVLAYLRDRRHYPRGTRLVLGNALVGRLLKSVLDLGVAIALGTGVERLEIADGRVAGVVVAGPAGERRLTVSRGVVLATGGFSHDAALRRRYLPEGAGDVTAAPLGNAGDGLRLGTAIGGRIGAAGAEGAFWAPMSRLTRADGTVATFPHTVLDRAKPGIIAVDASGQRFANEARSYHELAKAMLRPPRNVPAIPAYLVCDRAFVRRYGIGAVRPQELSLRRYIASGYLVEGRSLAELAGKLGIDAAGLEATVARYNEDARTGVDRQFGRGGDAYQRALGDPTQTPNPCMRPIEGAPFFAVRLYVGDLGTARGLETNEVGQVLRDDRRPLPGLYACGNDMHSIMGGAYPGPGITLGPAMTFGYLAARHIAGAD